MVKNETTFTKENFTTKYGSTLEEQKPSVIYLRTKSRITPSLQMKEYGNEISNVKNAFAKFVEKTVTESKSVMNEYLFNIEISSKSISFGKPSFLRYDIYLKPAKIRTLNENLFRMRQISEKLNKEMKRLLKNNKMTFA